MGVDINTNRCRVGMFVPGGGCGFVSLFITFGRVTKLLGSLTLTRILLVMAGVEQNPGPADKYIFCYQYLLIEIGTDVMRRIFDIRVGNDFGQYLSANNTENGKLQKLIFARIITAGQIQNLPPIDNSPKSSNFDITLLSCLLRNVCGLRGRSNAVWKNPAPTDVSLEADLARLKECRNNLQHSGTVFISETDLKVKWNELSQILTRLNVVCGIPNLSTLINTAEKMDIDETLQKRHDQAIKAWIKMEDEIEGLKISYSELKTQVENTEQSHESSHKNVGMDESDLRNLLMKIYKEDCRSLPVTPLCDEDEVEVELLSIYEPPSLYHVPYHRTPEKEEKYSISSYEEIFRKNDRSFRKIYITGDAGVGKTSFCKRMSLLWCKSQSGESVDNESVQNDIDFMAKFDFVFYVSLGATHRKDVVTMIVEQLLSIEHDGKKNEMYESIEHFLRKNECIIIMDAFDEWTPKERGKININKLSSDKCKFVTTCRAYKIENERLSHRDIDRQVHMTGINLCSSKRYVKEIVNHINQENGDNKNPDDFIRDVKKCKLTAQLRIPMIASHLVAVWFDHKLTNMNKALIYSNIVDMLLKRAEKRKHIELPSLTESKVQFPDPLSELFYLKKHSSILNKICLLSFNILFKQDKCFSDLVFTAEQLESEPYCVSAKEMDFLCTFGILSKTKVICGFGKREQKLSYLHKSYLEYFAALFVYSFDSSNVFDDVVKKWSTINDVVKFENFFLFIVGFSSKKSKVVFENIYHTISSLCSRNAISHNDGYSYKKQLKSLQTMVIKCLKESSDTILSFKLEDIFGNNVISDIDNDGSFYDDDNYEDYNDDDNDNDGHYPDDDDYERHMDEDNDNDGHCPDYNDYENYNDDDDVNDGYCPDDNDYERHTDDDNDNDGHNPDDNDYENYNDDDDVNDGYCPDDDDYERHIDDDKDNDGHCPDDNDYERHIDDDNDNDGHNPDDNDYENYNDDDDVNDGYCPDANDYERLTDYDNENDGYCHDANDYERHTDDDNENDGYCHDDNDYERHTDDENENDGHCHDDNDYERHTDDENENDGHCHDDNDYERHTDDDNDNDGHCHDDNDYERHIDDDNDNDGYCHDDNDYERHTDDDNENDGYCHDDNDYERHTDDDNENDGYCHDDNDYERHTDDDNENDGYCHDDNDYERHTDDDNENDGYCHDDNDYERHTDDDNENDGYCHDDNDYERHTDDDNENDGYCHDDNDYERHTDDDNENDGYCHDDNDYERHTDDDNENDGYCHDDNDYERHTDDDNDNDGHCPDANDYERHTDDDNENDGYCHDDNDYERHTDDDNENDGYCPDDNDYENSNYDDNDSDRYCHDDNDYENYNDDDNDSNGYCPDDNHYENYTDDNDIDSLCPDDNDNEKYNDNDNDGHCPDVNEYEKNNLIIISMAIVLMMIIMKINEEKGDEGGSCSDDCDEFI